MSQYREKCILCNGRDLSTLFTNHMPVFMGVNLHKTEEFYNPMSFTTCNTCGEVQIRELLDLDVLYQNNHNINIVGNTWRQHYIELANFIADNVKDRVILEISDPSAKVAKLSKGYKRWYIVEPNPEKIEVQNVEFINKFFDEDFDNTGTVDVILHSHLLEHMHDPNLFFEKCNKLLHQDGLMFISVPNMEYLLSRQYSPNNILHFEHTYYLDYKVLEFLANTNGFRIIESKNYKNHSIFYKLKKDSTVTTTPLRLDIREEFRLIFQQHIDKIKYITTKIEEYNYHSIYIFGAHVSSQFYLFNGLPQTNILSILDNDVNKQGHKLYGTALSVDKPDVVKNLEKCVVICSHVGVYYDEIAEQLLSLNKNIILL